MIASCECSSFPSLLGIFIKQVYNRNVILETVLIIVSKIKEKKDK